MDRNVYTYVVFCIYLSYSCILYLKLQVQFNFSILECCESLKVYYDTDEVEYTYRSIYGFYIKQNNKTNGRNWYRNDARSIWWDGIDDWWIGLTDALGEARGYAYLKKDGSCLPEISDTSWKLYDGKKWDDAGKKLNVRCGFRPTGRWAFCNIGMNVTILK